MSAVFPGDVNTLDQGHTLFKNSVLEDFPKSCNISICGALRVFPIYEGSSTQPTQEVGLQRKFTPSLASL